jgi:Uma2 family endonuclease
MIALAPTITLPRHQFTVTDYHKMIESGILGEDDPIELIYGELIKMSPMNAKHASLIGHLLGLLHERLGRKVFITSQTPLRAATNSEPEPDIMVLKSRPDRYRTALPQAEDVLLIIEVSDTTLTYDRDVKAPLYASAGLSEYWLINLNENCIEVFREPTPNGYRQQTKFWRADTLSLLAFPEVAITAGEILD